MNELDRCIDEIVDACISNPTRGNVYGAVLMAYAKGVGNAMRATGKWPSRPDETGNE